jgi:phosphatidate cytidylyltransferase
LDPIISPKKTIEGAIGGVIISAGVATFFFLYLKENVFGCEPIAENSIPLWGPAVAGALIAVTGLMGDLLESVIKRACKVKDSGHMLPGLGGIWDVTDSLFFAAPIGYMAVLAGWIG